MRQKREEFKQRIASLLPDGASEDQLTDLIFHIPSHHSDIFTQNVAHLPLEVSAINAVEIRS